MVSALSWFVLTSAVLTGLGAWLLGYAAKATGVFRDGSTLADEIAIFEKRCHIPPPGGVGE